MCWSRLTLDCDGTRPGKKNWLFLRFPEEALNTKDTARQRRDQKRVPLFQLPRRGGEKRGGLAPLVYMVFGRIMSGRKIRASRENSQHSNEEHGTGEKGTGCFNSNTFAIALEQIQLSRCSASCAALGTNTFTNSRLYSAEPRLSSMGSTSVAAMWPISRSVASLIRFPSNARSACFVLKMTGATEFKPRRMSSQTPSFARSVIATPTVAKSSMLRGVNLMCDQAGRLGGGTRISVKSSPLFSAV